MPAHKSRYRHLFILFSLIVAVGLILWLARIPLIEFATDTSMRRADLENTIIDIDAIGTHGSQINLLDFTLTTESGTLRLEARDIDIEYQLTALSEGHMDSVTIKDLALYNLRADDVTDKKGDIDESGVDAGNVDTVEISEKVRVITRLRQTLRDYLLVKTLSIENITFKGEDFAGLEDKTFRLRATVKEQSLYTDIMLLDAKGIQQSAHVIIDGDTFEVELGLEEEIDTLPVKLSLTIDEKNIAGDYRIEPKLLQRWLHPFVVMKDIGGIMRTQGSITIRFDEDKDIGVTLTAATDRLIHDVSRGDNLAITLKLLVPDHIPLDHLRLEKGTSLKLGTFKYGDISLTDTPIYLVGDVNKSKDNWEFDGGLRSDRLSLMQQSQTFRVKDIAAHLTIDAEALTINGGFSPDPLPGKFDFSIRHSLNTASGQLRVRQKDPVDLTADNDKLSQLLTPWPYPFDLLTGSISLESDASWSKNKSFSLSVEMKLDEGGGHIDELLFSGLSFEHRLLILPVLSSTQPGEVRLAHIDSGVDVDNIGMDLAIHSPGTDARPELVVTNLHGEILNGSFGSDRLIYDLNRSNNAFRITATDIDLAEIVKTQQLNDIEVTGKISGSIPVEINKKGLSIKNGSFINSIKNGTIRYDPATGTEQLKQNPLTGVALEALKDFRYTYLSAGVNFDPDGTLAVNLQLKGVSPELDTDRPVHLNINTEQDLLSLLKSLRYAQGISEKIDSRVRRQYEKTH